MTIMILSEAPSTHEKRTNCNVPSNDNEWMIVRLEKLKHKHLNWRESRSGFSGMLPIAV